MWSHHHIIIPSSCFDLIFTNFPQWKLENFMTAGKRISRRTFWAQLQFPSLICLEDIEGQSKNRHWNRIEIMPNARPNTSTCRASLCSTIWRLSLMWMEGWLCIDMSLPYVVKTWTLCTYLSQYVDDNNGWKLFFNSRGIKPILGNPRHRLDV